MVRLQLLDMRKKQIRLYRFYINNIEASNEYDYNELVRVFIPDSDFEVISVNFDDSISSLLYSKSFFINKSKSDNKDDVKRELYEKLVEITGFRPPWGILTGVRPLKIAQKLYNKCEDYEYVSSILREKYLISDEKISLLINILKYQNVFVCGNSDEKISIYIGIPFCPTRCTYCSFASNEANEEEIEKYLSSLCQEIRYMASLASKNGDVGNKIESIYIGGGTPTTLSAEQLKILIDVISDSFQIYDLSKLEFTVEAGRPDTITYNKLQVIKSAGIKRISINPQTMNDNTLKVIGRKHSSNDTRAAYQLADKVKFDIINADLIAGLPNENFEDFKKSLEEIVSLGANNITIHTLSIKNGSMLKDNNPDYYRKNSEEVSKMLDYAGLYLAKMGFRPYYIYRQKHQVGALENVGYCKIGTHSLYNIRIMDDRQTIIAMGAGTVGKVYFPEDDRIERIANISNYQIYSERIEEILNRKNKYYGGSDGDQSAKGY